MYVAPMPLDMAQVRINCSCCKWCGVASQAIHVPDVGKKCPVCEVFIFQSGWPLGVRLWRWLTRAT